MSASTSTVRSSAGPSDPVSSSAVTASTPSVRPTVVFTGQAITEADR